MSQYRHNDIVGLNEFYHFLPISPRLPYHWYNTGLLPEPEDKVGKPGQAHGTRDGWKVGTIIKWWRDREEDKTLRSETWSSRAAHQARTNTVVLTSPQERDLTEDLNLQLNWGPGARPNTEETIVRFVRRVTQPSP